jgi:beta-galactosidase
MTAATRPGKLVELVSATVEEVRPYHHGQMETVNFARGALIAEQCQVGTWVEVLHCISAESVAEYVDGHLAGRTAISQRAHGRGQVYYLGVHLPQDVLERFLSDILPDFFIKNIPEGVEVSIRRGEQGRFVFIVNHNAESQRLQVPGTATDLLSDETMGPRLRVTGNGVLLLKA